MIKKLHRLIFSAYIGPFLLTFCIAMFFLIMQFLWKYIDDLLGKGLDTPILTELMFYASANLVPMALPIAILLSSIMTFGNLVESNEMTAMKSAGLSNLRIMQPLIIFITLISIGSFFFANYTWPVANLKFRALITDIAQQKPALQFREKVFNTDIDYYSIRIDKRVKNSADHFEGLRIADHTPQQNTSLPLYKKDIVAKAGNIKKTTDNKYMVMTLENGSIHEELLRGMDSSDVFARQTTTFSEAKIRIDLTSLKMERTDTDLFKDLYEMFNLQQLEHAIDSVQLLNEKIIDSHAERLKLSFMIFREPIKSRMNLDSALSKANEIPHMNARIDNIRVNANNPENGAASLRITAKAYSDDLNRIFTHQQIIQLMKVEWHRKLTLPVACFLLFFIGASMGTIIKKGGIGAPIVVATILFLFYYIISITGEKMAKGGVLSPFTGMWLSALILAPIAVFLIFKSNSDSRLFDKDTYLKFLGIKRSKKVNLPTE